MKDIIFALGWRGNNKEKTIHCLILCSCYSQLADIYRKVRLSWIFGDNFYLLGERNVEQIVWLCIEISLMEMWKTKSELCCLEVFGDGSIQLWGWTALMLCSCGSVLGQGQANQNVCNTAETVFCEIAGVCLILSMQDTFLAGSWDMDGEWCLSALLYRTNTFSAEATFSRIFYYKFTLPCLSYFS